MALPAGLGAALSRLLVERGATGPQLTKGAAEALTGGTALGIGGAALNKSLQNRTIDPQLMEALAIQQRANGLSDKEALRQKTLRGDFGAQAQQFLERKLASPIPFEEDAPLPIPQQGVPGRTPEGRRALMKVLRELGVRGIANERRGPSPRILPPGIVDVDASDTDEFLSDVP